MPPQKKLCGRVRKKMVITQGQSLNAGATKSAPVCFSAGEAAIQAARAKRKRRGSRSQRENRATLRSLRRSEAADLSCYRK